MDRQEFLNRLGVSAVFVVFAGCMGGCKGEKSEDPTPNPGNPDGKVDFTLNLNDAANTALNSAGGFVYKNGLIVARAADGAFLAVSQACTHEGFSVTYQAANNRFNCSNHGSNFNAEGGVINGPAASPLKKYNTTLTGTTLRVYE